MQIKSVNFVKSETVPAQVRNTELNDVARAVVEQIAKCPAGQAVSFELDKPSKWTRYTLQRKVQTLGAKAKIVAGEKGKFFAVKVS